MPDINLGAMSIPAFVTIWGAGWLSCFAILVRPLIARIEKMEIKQSETDHARDAELIALRKRFYGE